MKINLSKIKASPNPIRKTWDEAKLNELKWSLMEEGQVEPIGVHENGNSYVIVWGHRRVEAARRAGWTEIESVIVPHDEVNNLIQAGIENLASEDMSTDDKAEWAQRLIDLGLSQNEISRRSSVSSETIAKWLIYKHEKDAGIPMGIPGRKGDTDYRKIVEIKRVLQDDLDAKKEVAQKVADEDLSTLQTRAVAEAYRDAPTPEVKKKVLEVPIVSRDTASDILRRSINRVEMETGVKVQKEMNEWEKEREERQVMQAWDFAVKEFLDATRLYAEVAKKTLPATRYGKFTPEAARFAIRKAQGLIDDLKTLIEELEDIA